nr:VENN motif pre-toxin domain-containing protein [Gilliamella sp. ESL0250]
MAVSLINGLISGDIKGAAAGALAPKIATIIKQQTEGNTVANTVSHAILGAVVAELQGNSALVGGLGAAASERGAEVIAGILYPDKDIKDLSQEERQKVSALSQLATGLAIAAADGDIQDINTGVAAGKNAVENNGLNILDHYRTETEKDLDEIEQAKRLFGGDEDKAWEYVLGKKRAEASGAVDGIIDTVDGTVNTVLHPIDTVTSIYDAITNPDKVYEAIKISFTEWLDLYDYALKNDPALAGEMMGHFEGKLSGEVGSSYVIGGASAEIIQQVARLKTLSKAGKMNDNVGKSLSVSEQRAVRSLEEQIRLHEKKLAEYKRDPYSFDNKGHLKNAPNEEVRQKIINARIKHLEHAINTFKNNINKIKNKG